MRQRIDAPNGEIVGLIGRRSRFVRAAARFKTSATDVRAPERQRTMLEQRRRWAEEEGLNPGLIEELYKGLIAYFVSREMGDRKGAD